MTMTNEHDDLRKLLEGPDTEMIPAQQPAAPTNRQKLEQAANVVGNIDQAAVQEQLGAMAWDQMILKMKLKALYDAALPLADQADAKA